MDVPRFHLYVTTPSSSAAPFVLRLPQMVKEMVRDMEGVPRLYTFSNVDAPAVLHVCFTYAAGEAALVDQVERAVAWMKAQPVSAAHAFNVSRISLAKLELLVDAEQVDASGPRWTLNWPMSTWTLPAPNIVAAVHGAHDMLHWTLFCKEGTGDMRTLFPTLVRKHVIKQTVPQCVYASNDHCMDDLAGDMSSFMNLLDLMKQHPEEQQQPDQHDLGALFPLLQSWTAPEQVELRVGDWVAYIHADRAHQVVCTQITGFDFSRPCSLTLQNLEHTSKVAAEQLAFARLDPHTLSLTSRLAPLTSYRLVV